MKRFNYYLLSLVILTSCILISCKKDVQPYNPYADIIYPVNNINDNSSSPNSLTRTHEEVFEPKCNVLAVTMVLSSPILEHHKAAFLRWFIIELTKII